MNNESYSENVFQDNVVKELERYKWVSPEFLDGNKKRVTVEDLENNWRNELNRLNADQLEGIPLTDTEFDQVMSKVKAISNSFEAAKILAMEGSIGKIDGIYRCDNPKVTRKQITLTIFNKAEVSGGSSRYQVAREVWGVSGNRFDLVLLINGLPLINIELKRTDVPLVNAFGQFKRYYKDGEYTNNFMAFSQMMVIMSDIETRYFATPKRSEDFNISFVFNWADRNNTPVHEYTEVIKQFLMIPMAHQMVGDYLVIDESKDEEKRKHMILRPYQVYALQSVAAAAFGYDNDDKIPHGGFIWHTTGSGKTITSFKSALFLSSRGGFDKVVFLVDRKDLDQKTSAEFKAYSSYEAVDVDDTKRTYELANKLNSSNRGIVVTTTFKLNALVKELEENNNYKLKDKKIAFIIDEAHRTTMGDMMVNIKSYFNKNALFFGFTGTPLFEENEASGKINHNSELINTTEKLFGPLLHQYTIDEAIQDENVLGFHIDYVNTGEFESYDKLREDLIELEKNNSGESDLNIERKYHTLSNLEIEKLAVKNKLLHYNDDLHIPRVVEIILDNYDMQSQNRFFNSIFTVEYKERVIKYYNEFKKQLKERNQQLNVVMTFSFGNENDPDNVAPEVMSEMFKDYAKFTGIEFRSGDLRRGEKDYFEDIVDRSTRGGSGRNPKNIDIMIVAEQLLTGYDNKYLNTLYVDRQLKLQSLIQAYSRTNRVFGKTKEFGTVINFKYPEITKKQVEEALKLYGSGGTNNKVIMDEYDVAVNKFTNLVKQLKETLSNPTEWATIKDTPLEEDFVKLFKEVNNQFNIVSQYYAYEWDSDLFGLSEHEWMKYTGAYKNLTPKDEVDEEIIPVQTLGKTKIAGVHIVDSKFIIELIDKKVDIINGVRYIDDESLKLVYEKIQELSDLGNHSESLLLKEFVEEELLHGNVDGNETLDEIFSFWKKNKEHDEIFRFSEKWGIDTQILISSFERYSISEPDVVPYIEEIIKNTDFNKAKDQSYGNHLKHVLELTKGLPKWMKATKQKY